MRGLKNTMVLLGAALALPGRGAAELVETRMLEDEIAVDGAGLTVVVDNVFGSIHVSAHDKAVVEMRATETVRGDVRSDIERARAEMGLRTVHEGDRLAFLVRRTDGDGNGDCPCHRWGDGYAVAYDIELVVPHDVAIELSTVNEGDIIVDGVDGDFEVANINGAVTLSGLRGSGRVSTVNGPIDVSFERAPERATSFKTVNGPLEIAFPRDLSADLTFKTMHGEIWTDFDTEVLAASPVTEQRRDRGASVFRVERRSAVRVGRGGPTHSFETLNGDIEIRQVSQ